MRTTLLRPDLTRSVTAVPHGAVGLGAGPDPMQRIDSTHSIWLFDTERMRFRRLPKGSDPDAPALQSDWQPYFALDVDHRSGAFTVALNEDRTRLIRAWRDDAGVPGAAGDLGTGEVQLEVVEPDT